MGIVNNKVLFALFKNSPYWNDNEAAAANGGTGNVIVDQFFFISNTFNGLIFNIKSIPI